MFQPPFLGTTLASPREVQDWMQGIDYSIKGELRGPKEGGLNIGQDEGLNMSRIGSKARSNQLLRATPFLGTPLAPLREVEDWMQTTQWEMELHLVRPGNVQTTKDGDHKTISFLQRRKP